MQIAISPLRQDESRSDRVSGLRSLLQSWRVRLSQALPFDELAERVRVARPAWVTGHPHVLAAVGNELQAAHRPRLVTTFGVSADDHLRTEVADGFGRAPLDIYGAMELQLIAWQCRFRDLYHLAHEAVFVEVRRRRRPTGGAGRRSAISR